MKSLTDPTNRDTELAMVTKGEFVSPKETMEIYGPTLAAQRNHGLALRAARNKAFLEGKPIPKMVPAPEITAMNSGGIMLSDEDKDLLIRMAAAEARSESPEAQAAVMYVALNRQKANREEFSGDKIKDIINRDYAFTSVKDPKNNHFYDMKDSNIPKSDAYKKAAGILDDMLSGKIKDPTGGAEFFLNEELTKQIREDGKLPSWWENTHNRKRIGRHTFALHNDIHGFDPELTKRSHIEHLNSTRRDDQAPLFVPEVTKSIVPSVRGAQNRIIPEYNPGGFVGGLPIEEEEDHIMNFMKNHQGRLGDVNPEDVAAGIISDEDLLQNSSDSGANSFREANQMQYGDPRQSIPMPGAFMGNITDAQSLRGGVVRPDMMPPGYVPPKPEVIQRTTSPQGGADQIAADNIVTGMSNTDNVPRPRSLMNLSNMIVPPAYADSDGWKRAKRIQLKQYLKIQNNPDIYNKMSKQEQGYLQQNIDKLQEALAAKDTNQTNLNFVPGAQTNFNRKVYSNGDEYVGDFENGERHGPGTYTFASGAKYVGEWKDGNQHGLGTHTLADGRVLRGRWENGKFIGDATTENTSKADGSLPWYRRWWNSLSKGADWYGKTMADTAFIQAGTSYEETANKIIDTLGKVISDSDTSTEDRLEAIKKMTQVKENLEKYQIQSAPLNIKKIDKKIAEREKLLKEVRDAIAADPNNETILSADIERIDSDLINLNQQLQNENNLLGNTTTSADGGDKDGDDQSDLKDPYEGEEAKHIAEEYLKLSGERLSPNMETADSLRKMEEEGRRVKDPNKWNAAKLFLKDIFGDIFNKKDLMKAVAIYLGARIFGASGNQAGALAGKYYLGKQEQHEANVAAYTKAGKHKPTSIAKFAITRNIGDLELIGASVVPTNTYKTFYRKTRKGELKVVARKFNVGTKGSVWKRQIADPKNPGKTLWVSFDPTTPYSTGNWTTDGRQFKSSGAEYNVEHERVAKIGAARAKEFLEVWDADAEKFVPRLAGELTPGLAGSQWASWMLKHQLPHDVAEEMLMTAIAMMKQEYNVDPKKHSGFSSVKPYLDQSYVVVTTQGTNVSGTAFRNKDDPKDKWSNGEYIPVNQLKTAIDRVRQTAMKGNPKLEDLNEVMLNTAIVRNANKHYNEYLKRVAAAAPSNVNIDTWLLENDKYRKRANAMKPRTTPLFEFMNLGGIKDKDIKF